jgi:hypothetical protein
MNDCVIDIGSRPSRSNVYNQNKIIKRIKGELNSNKKHHEVMSTKNTKKYKKINE